jgi:proline dehydrogenase
MATPNDTRGIDAPVSFDNTQVAFEYKSGRELFLAWLIFSMTKNPTLMKLLTRMVKLLMAMKMPIKPLIKGTVFKIFCGGETKAEYEQVIAKLRKAHIGTILDYAVEGSANEAGYAGTEAELLKIITEAKHNPDIPCTCLKVTAVASFALMEQISAGKPLTTEQKSQWSAAKARLDRICAAAHDSEKPIYIDAEESWIQPAVDDVTEEMMARYNRSKAIVFTTLQMYRWDRLDYLKRLISDARASNYRLGVKIVRGAYMEQERERAREFDYPSPINPTQEATHRDYNAAIDTIMDNIEVVEICLGTHNEYSCKLLANLMAKRDLPNNHPHITFSQLYGMSDNISFNLSRAGYNVSKYLPYGPVEATLPYLTRRAEENTAIAGQMSKELEIIVKERERRKNAGQCLLCESSASEDEANSPT